MQARRVRALVSRRRARSCAIPRSIAIGVVLPVILILLFGYGLSLDVKNVPVAVVIEDSSPAARRAGRRIPTLALLSRPDHHAHGAGRAS